MIKQDQQLQVLQWDSEFFGRKMGRILIDPQAETMDSVPAWERLIAQARSEQYEFLFYEFDAADKRLAHLLTPLGGALADVLVKLAKPVVPVAAPQRKTDSPVQAADESDLAAVIELASHSFTHSRFFHDPGFDQELVRQLYPNWVRNNFAGNESYFVIKDRQSLQAFISVQPKPLPAALDIRLLAVHPDVQGKGLGSELLRWAEEYSRSQGLKRITVGTQINNYAALRLYEKSGFRVEQALYRYHFWLDSK